MKRTLGLIIALAMLAACFAGCSQSKKTYTVKWVDYDGTVLEIDRNVPQGTVPEFNGDEPAREKDAKHVYRFRGWSPIVLPVNGDTTYIADYVPAKVLGAEDDSEDWDEDTVKWIAEAKTKLLNSDSVPGGAAISTALDSVISFMTGVDLSVPDPLNEIKDKLDDLQQSVNDGFTNVENLIMSTAARLSEDIKKAIDQSERNIETMVLSQTTIANKGDSFDTLMSAINTTVLSLDTIRNNAKYTTQDKALLIANLIGSYEKWSNSDNIFASYLSFLDAVTKASYSTTNNEILFDLVYDQQLLNSQFSSESLYRGAPYVERIILLAFYAYNVCSECLLAAATVAQFTEDDLNKIDPTFRDKYTDIVSPLCVVQSHLDRLNSKLMELNYSEVSVLDRIAEYFDLDSRGGIVYYSQPGAQGIKLSDSLPVIDCGPGKFNDAYDAATDLSDFWNTDVFYNYEDSLAVVNHVKQTYSGMTLREFFSMIGYDVTNLPQGTYYMVNQDFDPPHFTYANYSGISIDDPNFVVNKVVVWEGGGSGGASTAITLRHG